MNFFGHAIVASEIQSDPQVVFGAMLPDLEQLAHVRIEAFASPRVALGISLHHLTDKAFHEGPDFLAHQGAAQKFLSAFPLRRGPRRAVAHVGVELILDAALNTPARFADYVRALRTGLEADALGQAPLVRRLKMRSVVGMLVRRSPLVTPTTPDGVAARLERALESRPALRLEPPELPFVKAWAEHAWQPIHERAQAWLEWLTEAVRAAPDHDARVESPQSTCADAGENV